MTPRDITLGVQACKDNIRRLLDEASACLYLLGSRSHALGIYVFAVEECGTALRLKDGLKPGGHRPNIQRALRDLPSACTAFYIGVIREDGSPDQEIVSFNKGQDSVWIDLNTTGSFMTDASIDAMLRIEGMYVRWDEVNQRWEPL